MSDPQLSTCSPWADADDVEGLRHDGASIDRWLQFASNALYRMTEMRWPGECTATYRPCGDRTCRCPHRGACSCTVDAIELPRYPVTAITEVLIDGDVVDPDRYRVDGYRYLVWQPESDTAPRQAWPRWQRLDRPTTEADTFSIEFTWGTLPPVDGVMSAAVLAAELSLINAPAGVGECRLPRRVTTMVRQGVTIAVLDPMTLFADGRTGLPEVDLWLGSLAKSRATRPAAVLVPEHVVPGTGRPGYR